MTTRKIVLGISFCLLLIPPAAPAEATPASSGEAQRIVSFLNQAIVWYRQQMVLQQVASDPTDILYVNQNRELSEEILRLSFDFARGRAQLLTATSGGDQ